jgi:hypothetical protein
MSGPFDDATGSGASWFSFRLFIFITLALLLLMGLPVFSLTKVNKIVVVPISFVYKKLEKI